MDDRTVQALGEVLDDQLPVRLQVVALGVGGAEVADSPRLEARGGRAELVPQSRALVGDPHEDDPAPLLAPRRGERVVRDREPLHPVHVRRPPEPTVEAVGPRVVRALDRARQAAALRSLDHPGPPVPADVVVRVDPAVRTAYHDQAVTRDLHQPVIPRFLEVVRRAGRVPHGPMDPFPLALEHRGIAVVAGRQRHRPRRCGRPDVGVRPVGRHVAYPAGVARFRGGSKNGSGATRDRARRRVYSTVISMSSGVPGAS